MVRAAGRLHRQRASAAPARPPAGGLPCPLRGRALPTHPPNAPPSLAFHPRPQRAPRRCACWTQTATARSRLRSSAASACCCPVRQGAAACCLPSQRGARLLCLALTADGWGRGGTPAPHRTAVAAGAAHAQRVQGARAVAPPTHPGGCRSPAAAGAHVSHRHIVSAWTDSTTWLECSDYKLGHVPPSQPLVGRGGGWWCSEGGGWGLPRVGQRARGRGGCSACKPGHVPPSQPLVGVRPCVTRVLRTHARRVRDRLALLARAARGGRALPVHRVPCLPPAHHLHHARSAPLQERFLAGGVAGAVSRTVVAPLERLRTILMAVRGW